MNETPKELLGRRLICFFALMLVTACAAGVASWYLFEPEMTLGDPFASAASPWELTLASARLLLPLLCEFLAIFIFAFSPLSIPVSMCVLCERAVRVSMMLRAPSSSDVKNTAAVCVYILSAVLLALFCAAGASLSPRLRTVSFSSFNGRREALYISVCFFTLSGAASLMTLGAGAILHLA